jgi:nucleoside phosphorylase
MLVIFSAFKKEAIGLLGLLKIKKIVKNKNTVIYDGTINNKRMIICITGMGKSNASVAASQVIEMKLENPVFLIQGISGSLIDSLKVGDLIMYESIRNLDQFKIEKKSPENIINVQDIQVQIVSKSTEEGDTSAVEINENILYLPYGEKSSDIEINNYYLFKAKGIKADPKKINADFNYFKNKWEGSTEGLRILKANGGLVSYVITDGREKETLHKLYDVEAIDMESYYIADIAINNLTPVICIRSISDSPGESIPDLILKFKSGNFFCKFACLIELIFSKTKIRSLLKTSKNISFACRNLNLFSRIVVLPYFGYRL